jgi:hypothetical protein
LRRRFGVDRLGVVGGRGADASPIAWHLDRRQHAVRRVRLELEARGIAVKRGEAFANVGEAHAAAQRVGEAAARVGDDQAQLIALDVRGDRHHAAFALWLEAVLDGVLDERGQHERREGCVHQLRGDDDLEGEPLAHAHLQDVQVSAHELDLLADGGDRLAHLGQCVAQVLDEVARHGVGLRRIDLGERLDACERVVEEMRFHLRLQRGQLGLGDLLAHAVVIGFPCASFPPAAGRARAIDEEPRPPAG